MLLCQRYAFQCHEVLNFHGNPKIVIIDESENRIALRIDWRTMAVTSVSVAVLQRVRYIFVVVNPSIALIAFASLVNSKTGSGKY